MKRTEKLSFIETFLLSKPEGATRRQIADALGVHRSTIGRCIDDLSFNVPITENENKIISINRTEYLNNIKLNIHEVLTLYLAVRLLNSTFKIYSPHLYTAMKKTAEAVKKMSPLFSKFIKLTAEEILQRKTMQWKNKIETLETITEGWINKKKIRIEYNSKNTNSVHIYTISVYFIEPYTPGKTIYVFTYADEVNEKRTFRLGRIVKAELLNEKYKIENNFNYKNYFNNAWGIWNSGAEIKKVVLKFSPDAAERAAETIWHEDQKIENRKDGSAIYTLEISETLEMVPWIRGWGSDVEVLEPKELRDFMRKEAGKLGEMYG